MKCLSLMQPWAALVASGAKRFETRDWRTAYTGPLAIQASRSFTDAARALCQREPFRSALARAGYRQSADLPTGVLVGSVELVECLPVGAVLSWLHDCPEELALGNFENVRWAWRLTEARPYRECKPCRGRLGLFEATVQNELF